MADVTQGMLFKIDLDAGLQKRSQRGILMCNDKNANKIIIEVMRKNYTERVNLNGVSVVGEFVRQSGCRVPLIGTVSGNAASIVLNEHCYVEPGAFEAFVRFKLGDALRTVLYISGNVSKNADGPIVDTENVIPSLDDLLGLIDEMRQVTAEAREATENANAVAQNVTTLKSALDNMGRAYYPLAEQPEKQCPIVDIRIESFEDGAEYYFVGSGRASNEGKIVHYIRLKSSISGDFLLLNAVSANYTEPDTNTIIKRTVSGVGTFYYIVNWERLNEGERYNYKNAVKFSDAIYSPNNKLGYIEIDNKWYPYAEEVSEAYNALADIFFTSHEEEPIYVESIRRGGMIGNSQIHSISLIQNGDTFPILNARSGSYSEPDVNTWVRFSVGAHTGFYRIDWSKIVDGSIVAGKKKLDEKVLHPEYPESYVENYVESYVEDAFSAYPFTKVDTRIPNGFIEFTFTKYERTNNYYLKRVSKNVNTGGSQNAYVIALKDDNNTDYIIWNAYICPETFDFDKNGIAGKVRINWNLLPESCNYPNLDLKINPLVFSMSDAKNESFPKFTWVIPDDIYGVVGHPFSIYYYNILQIDNLEGYHIYVNGCGPLVQNLGDKIRFSCMLQGEYRITINLRKDSADNIAYKTFRVHIFQENIPTIKAIVIGDSFVDGGKIQAELTRLMGDKITLYGTRSFINVTDSDGNPQSGHDEGRSGWLLENYCTLAEKNGVANAFWDGNTFNFSDYIDRNSNFSDVTDVFILSGPNDNSPDTTNYKKYYQQIVDSIKSYSASIRIHCMMPITCVCLGRGWGKRNTNTGAEEYRYNMIGFGRSILDMFTDKENISVIPTHVNIDKDYDFETTKEAVSDRNPTLITVFNNNVHPNEYGYFSMADMIYGDINHYCN